MASSDNEDQNSPPSSPPSPDPFASLISSSPFLSSYIALQQWGQSHQLPLPYVLNRSSTPTSLSRRHTVYRRQQIQRPRVKALLQSGEFGPVTLLSTQLRPRIAPLPGLGCGRYHCEGHPPSRWHAPHGNHLTSSLYWRQRAPRTSTSVRQFYHNVLPSEGRSNLALQYNDAVYCGQYSQDGQLFCVATQGFQVNVFGVDAFSGLHHQATLAARIGRWTLTDLDITSDNRFVVFSSITSILQIGRTDGSGRIEMFKLDPSPVSFGGGLVSLSEFGVWSVRFADNGQILVAGTNSHMVYVYDVATRTVLDVIDAHDDDVNALCLPGPSKNIVCSGSDDGLIKVWDLRKRGNQPKPVGVFCGHTEGVTYLTAKEHGDQYIASNGKDQKLKLWDMRKLRSSEDHDTTTCVEYRLEWDYRWEKYPSDPNFIQCPHDDSVMTMMGHSVGNTLIRCRFSPALTGGQYIYSGSSDGTVYIYNLLGDLVKTLQPNEKLWAELNEHGHIGDVCPVVRDVSWHPYLPVMMASYFTNNQYNRGGVIRYDCSDGASP